MFTDKQIEQVVDLLATLDTTTKLYFGCDSIAYRKVGDSGKPEWWAKFATVLIVHMNGKNGCRIFRNISHERIFDKKKGRPADRLMKEVYKVTALYTQMIGFVDEFDCEIHLDINEKTEYGSSCVATQAAGYVLGVTGVTPILKPDAFAASFGADGIGRGFDKRTTSYTPQMVH